MQVKVSERPSVMTVKVVEQRRPNPRSRSEPPALGRAYPRQHARRQPPMADSTAAAGGSSMSAHAPRWTTRHPGQPDRGVARDQLEALAGVVEDLAGQFELRPLLRADPAARRRPAGLRQRLDLHRRRARRDLPQGGRPRRRLPLRRRVPVDRGGHRGDPAGRRAGDLRRVLATSAGGHIDPVGPGRTCTRTIGVPIRWAGSVIGACIVFSRDPDRTFRGRGRHPAGTVRRARRAGDGQRPDARAGRRVGPRRGDRPGTGTGRAGRPRLGVQGAGLGGAAPGQRGRPGGAGVRSSGAAPHDSGPGGRRPHRPCPAGRTARAAAHGAAAVRTADEPGRPHRGGGRHRGRRWTGRVAPGWTSGWSSPARRGPAPGVVDDAVRARQAGDREHRRARRRPNREGRAGVRRVGGGAADPGRRGRLRRRRSAEARTAPGRVRAVPGCPSWPRSPNGHRDLGGTVQIDATPGLGHHHPRRHPVPTCRRGVLRRNPAAVNRSDRRTTAAGQGRAASSLLAGPAIRCRWSAR